MLRCNVMRNVAHRSRTRSRKHMMDTCSSAGTYGSVRRCKSDPHINAKKCLI